MSHKRKDAVALINKHDRKGRNGNWVSGRNGVLKAEIQRANNALSGRKGASFPPMCTAGHKVDVCKPYSYVGYADAPPQQYSRHDEPVPKLSLSQVAQRLRTDTEVERKRKERSEAFAAGMKRRKAPLRMMKPRGVLPFKSSLRMQERATGELDMGFVSAEPPKMQETLAKKREMEEAGKQERKRRRLCMQAAEQRQVQSSSVQTKRGRIVM
eukprot:COSAG03_NODE_2240_length_2965_cov_86.498255_2_plen_212_part_00